MKQRILTLIGVCALATAVGAAQAPAAGGAQAPAPGGAAAGAPRGGGGGGRGAAAASPEAHADGTVTIRFTAPNANNVTLIGELDGKTYPMTKDANGVWSVTVGPWPHDVYNYQFRVDADANGRGGVVAMDPQNPSVKLGFGAFPPASMVEIPEKGGALAFDDAKNVPHGSVRMEIYHSKSLGMARTLWIYTPPGYD